MTLTYVIFILALLIAISTVYYFLYNDTTTTEIYTLSLHDALPIYHPYFGQLFLAAALGLVGYPHTLIPSSSSSFPHSNRSEEHTSELQSHSDLVCRLLLEKKKSIQHKSYDA